jgi:DNA-binding transcriptional MerR regulator
MATVYSPKDIADLLNIKESTLRKYSLMLEEVGYTFHKNDRNQRWYEDKDVIAFKKVIALKNSGDMNLKKAIEAVYMWSNGQSISLPSTDTKTDVSRYKEDIDELKSMVTEQGRQIAELKEIITQQNKYINERLEERDRTLMQSLREVQETKRLIAAEREEEEKKTFWQRLFKG